MLKGAASDLEQVLASAPRFMDDERREILCEAFQSRIGMLQEMSPQIVRNEQEQELDQNPTLTF